MSDNAPPWHDDYQALLTFVGKLCSQLQKLADQVDDQGVKAKLRDLVDQCGDQFFEGIFKTSERKQSDED